MTWRTIPNKNTSSQFCTKPKILLQKSSVVNEALETAQPCSPLFLNFYLKITFDFSYHSEFIISSTLVV